MHDTQHAAIGELLTALASVLNPTKPIAVFDCETTGVAVEQDRIVEITVARFNPKTGDTESFHALVNPGRQIPKEASDIHGITNEQVKDQPKFAAVARQVCLLLAGADLLGFRHRRFDVKLIAAECRRVGLPDPCAGARMIDACDIFHKREPRTLEAALQFYCGVAHDDAHGTTADVIATLQVLVGQFGRYDDLPRDLDALHEIGRDPTWIDAEGKLKWAGGDVVFAFGKHQGVPLKIADRSYVTWVMNADWCPADTREILRHALKGEYPVQAVAVEA